MISASFLDEFNFLVAMRFENVLSPVQATSRVETVWTSSAAATTSFTSGTSCVNKGFLLASNELF